MTTRPQEVDLRNALGLLDEQLEEVKWKDTLLFIDAMYKSGEYTHAEVRDAVGYVFEDRGYDRFDERYGVDDPNEDA